jgi:hypothetical protein
MDINVSSAYNVFDHYKGSDNYAKFIQFVI